MSVGLDLLEVERLQRVLARRPRLAERLFTEGERAYAAGRAAPAQHLAARFCAKEAVVKALGLSVMRPLEIEVVGGGTSAVRVALHGATAAEAGPRTVQVSLTHTPVTAAAVALAS